MPSIKAFKESVVKIKGWVPEDPRIEQDKEWKEELDKITPDLNNSGELPKRTIQRDAEEDQHFQAHGFALLFLVLTRHGVGDGRRGCIFRARVGQDGEH